MDQLALELDVSVEPGLTAEFDEERIRALVGRIVASEIGTQAQGQRYLLGVHLVGDEAIRGLNREHRDRDVPTDVLSFPLHDPTGMRFVLPPGQPINLGDVIVSYSRVKAQAEEYGHSEERELAYLVAHGVLHILGYDHEEDEERERMRAREEEALEPLGFGR